MKRRLNLYQATRHEIRDDSQVHIHRCENLHSHLQDLYVVIASTVVNTRRNYVILSSGFATFFKISCKSTTSVLSVFVASARSLSYGQELSVCRN